MAPERCPVCQSDRGSSRRDPCDHGEIGVAPGHELSLRTAVSRRLARAWISLGAGGMTVFLASTVFALGGHYGTFAWLASLGGALLFRGARVVSMPRRQLIQLTARAALPAARVIP
ncbi:MAG TPA: hypothetical protein VFT22_16510 [Kofleriaceae bacterium]|nr:hypothetical protein [Kofleriaceae bacterium]